MNVTVTLNDDNTSLFVSHKPNCSTNIMVSEKLNSKFSSPVPLFSILMMSLVRTNSF